MNNPFELQLNKGIKKVFTYTLYDDCSCEVMTCNAEEISQVLDEYVFVRMDYSIPAFMTKQFASMYTK